MPSTDAEADGEGGHVLSFASVASTDLSPGRSRRPPLLLILIGLGAFLSIFDQVITVSTIPFMRNPAALAGALAVLLYVWFRRYGVPLYPGAQRWVLVFLLYTMVLELVRGIHTGDPQVLRYMQWVQVLVLAFVTIDLARDRRAFGYVWGGFVAAAVFMAVTTVFGLSAFTYVHEGRVGFAGVNLNTQGYWSALAATSVLWWLVERWPRLGWTGVVAMPAFGVLSLALLQTASRGALVALVVGLGIVLVTSFRSRNLSAYATIVPIALLLIGLFLADATVLVDRFSNTVEEADFGARDSILLHGIALLTREPLLGYGPRYVEDLGEARGRPRSTAAHNSYLQVALTFGLPGLFLWLCIVASALVRSLRALNRGRDPVAALMVALLGASLVFGLAGDLGFDKFFWIMIALASGLQLVPGDVIRGRE